MYGFIYGTCLGPCTEHFVIYGSYLDTLHKNEQKLFIMNIKHTNSRGKISLELHF